MSRTTTAKSTVKAATAPAKRTASKRTPLDLATAEQTNGALPSFRSAWDLVGIKDVRYRERTFAEYSRRLHASDLAELHDEAYDKALSCSPSRPYMIQQLEDKYLRENPEQRAAVAAARQAEEADEGASVAVRAARIMAQGR